MSFWNALPMQHFAHTLICTHLCSIQHMFCCPTSHYFAFSNQAFLAACIYDISLFALESSLSLPNGAPNMTYYSPWLSTYWVVEDWRTRWSNHWRFLSSLRSTVIMVWSALLSLLFKFHSQYVLPALFRKHSMIPWGPCTLITLKHPGWLEGLLVGLSPFFWRDHRVLED